MATNHDSFVKANVVDNSVATPTPEPTSVGFSYLQPFFSKKGVDNVIQRFTGIGSFTREYGSDLTNVKKYGHGGLIAAEVLSGGGVVDACRLMPSAAKAAGIVFCVAIGTFGVAPNTKKYIRIVTKAPVAGEAANLAPYMIDATGAVITTIPVIDPEADPQPTSPTYYNVYPLFVATAAGKGTYGNDYGFEITLDTSRDGKNLDGRRYVIRFYDGSKVLGDAFDFISASFNPDAVAIPGSEMPDSYDIVYENYKKDYYLPVKSYYSSENFETIVTELQDFAGLTVAETEKVMIDFIHGVALKNQNYANMVFESVDYLSGMIKFIGGTDGGLYVDGVIDEDTVIDLLTEFYSGNIDSNLYDARIIDAGITLDAWWPMEVKAVMAGVFCEEVRDDIFVFLDLGKEVSTLTQAKTTAEQVAGYVSHPYGSVAINIHNGKTTNRVKNIRTSGNYEIASGLPTLYRTQGPFTVYAGYQSGRVRNMEFDFYPKVIKNNIEIEPLRENNLIFAMKLDRSKDFFFMSDDSQYKTDFSVLGSCANLIYIGEVIRTIRKVLVKYSFHPESALGAIPQATNELNTLFQGRWFPKKFPITFSIFQTRNDKINKNASVDLAITFPDVIETWKVTITANRTPLV